MIRPASQSDLPAIRVLHSIAGRPGHRALRASEFLVATRGDRVIGCAGVRLLVNGAGYLFGLVVHPTFRRQGIGSALTRARIRRLREAGASVALVLAMFWNVRFFRRLGFTLVSRDTLPRRLKALADIRSPRFRRSAVLRKHL